MSVDNHRHCQATVLSANGTGNQDGKSWGEINNLTLSNLPSNWKSYFTVNKNNVTQDFAATLKLIDKTVGDINSEITNIKYRLTIVEGQAGLLYDTDVTVYLAPSSDYFTSNSSIYQGQTDSDRRSYFTYRNGETPSYSVGSDKRIYPGDDNNFDKQCENYGTNNAKKYPLFSMEQAIKFLRQFRSSGGILYRIVTQFGDYYYDNDDTYRTKTIQHPDATGTSSIEIGPVMTKSQRQSLPCASTYNIETGKNSNGQSRPFNDDDLVKVRFVFSNEHLVANQPYAYGFQFLDSNTVVRNCGFYFRHDNGDKKNTFMFLSAKSGQVEFRGCLFRNVVIAHNIPSAPALISFGREYITENGKKPTDISTFVRKSDYILSNLRSYVLPNVFIDDDGAQIEQPFISSSSGDQGTIELLHPYVIFKTYRTNQCPIRVQQSEKLHLGSAYDEIGKIMCFDIQPNLNSNYYLMDVQPQSTLKFSTGAQVTSSIATNFQIEKQLQIELISTATLPQNLNHGYKIMSDCQGTDAETRSSYNPQTGGWNELLRQFREHSLVKFNGNPL